LPDGEVPCIAQVLPDLRREGKTIGFDPKLAMLAEVTGEPYSLPSEAEWEKGAMDSVPYAAFPLNWLIYKL